MRCCTGSAVLIWAAGKILQHRFGCTTLVQPARRLLQVRLSRSSDGKHRNCHCCALMHLHALLDFLSRATVHGLDRCSQCYKSDALPRACCQSITNTQRSAIFKKIRSTVSCWCALPHVCCAACGGRAKQQSTMQRTQVREAAEHDSTAVRHVPLDTYTYLAGSDPVQKCC